MSDSLTSPTTEIDFHKEYINNNIFWVIEREHKGVKSNYKILYLEEISNQYKLVYINKDRDFSNDFEHFLQLDEALKLLSESKYIIIKKPKKSDEIDIKYTIFKKGVDDFSEENSEDIFLSDMGSEGKNFNIIKKDKINNSEQTIYTSSDILNIIENILPEFLLNHTYISTNTKLQPIISESPYMVPSLTSESAPKNNTFVSSICYDLYSHEFVKNPGPNNKIIVDAIRKKLNELAKLDSSINIENLNAIHVNIIKNEIFNGHKVAANKSHSSRENNIPNKNTAIISTSNQLNEQNGGGDAIISTDNKINSENTIISTDNKINSEDTIISTDNKINSKDTIISTDNKINSKDTIISNDNAIISTPNRINNNPNTNIPKIGVSRMITIQLLGKKELIKNKYLNLENNRVIINNIEYTIQKSHVTFLQKLFTNWNYSDVVNHYVGKDKPMHRRTRFDRSVNYLKRITERLRDCTEISVAYRIKHKEVEEMLITIRKLYSLVIFLRDQIEKNQQNYDTLERLIIEITMAMNKDYHIPLPELIKLKEIQKKIRQDGKDLEERFKVVSNQILDRLNRAGALKDESPREIGESFPLETKELIDEEGNNLTSSAAKQYEKYIIPADNTIPSNTPFLDTTKFYKTEHSEFDGFTRGTGEPHKPFIDPDRVSADTVTVNQDGHDTRKFGEYEPGKNYVPYEKRDMGKDSKFVQRDVINRENENYKLVNNLRRHHYDTYFSTERPDKPELRGLSQHEYDQRAVKVADKYSDRDASGTGFDQWQKNTVDRKLPISHPEKNPKYEPVPPGQIPLLKPNEIPINNNINITNMTETPDYNSELPSHNNSGLPTTMDNSGLPSHPPSHNNSGLPLSPTDVSPMNNSGLPTTMDNSGLPLSPPEVSPMDNSGLPLSPPEVSPMDNSGLPLSPPEVSPMDNSGLPLSPRDVSPMDNSGLPLSPPDVSPKTYNSLYPMRKELSKSSSNLPSDISNIQVSEFSDLPLNISPSPNTDGLTHLSGDTPKLVSLDIPQSSPIDIPQSDSTEPTDSSEIKVGGKTYVIKNHDTDNKVTIIQGENEENKVCPNQLDYSLSLKNGKKCEDASGFSQVLPVEIRPIVKHYCSTKKNWKNTKNTSGTGIEKCEATLPKPQLGGGKKKKKRSAKKRIVRSKSKSNIKNMKKQNKRKKSKQKNKLYKK